jgi:hypothetical protein
MRGDAPTQECLAQWATPEPEKTEASTEATSAPVAKDSVALLDESFAAPLALAAALALYA